MTGQSRNGITPFCSAVCDGPNLTPELDYIRRTFYNNRYPGSFVDRAIEQAMRPRQPQEARERRLVANNVIRVAYPYVPVVSDRLKCLARRFGVELACKPQRTLRQSLCKLKTPKDPLHIPGVVYQIECAEPDCPKSYIGETGRWLATRISEHRENVNKPSHNERRGNPSALENHVRTTGMEESPSRV